MILSSMNHFYMLQLTCWAFICPGSQDLTVDVCCPLLVLFQKLPLTEYPLYLRLLAGPDTDVLSFVLKENETGEVEVRQWLSWFLHER